MRNINQYINSLLNNGALRWGFRLAFCITIPLIYGDISGKMEDAFWMAIAAQSVALIEYKGSFSIRMRILLGSAFFVVLFSLLGMIVGSHFYLLIFTMFLVGFISALFKNLGERGMGMSLSIFILFILSSAYPSSDFVLIKERIINVLIGAGIVFVVVIFGTLIQSRRKPFYNFMAHLFEEMKELIITNRSGWGQDGKFMSLHQIYLQESKIRELINTFLNFYNSSDEEKISESKNNILLQRKTTILIHSLLLNINEQAVQLRKNKNESNVDVAIHTILRIHIQILNLFQQYYSFQNEADLELIINRINRLAKLQDKIQKMDWTITVKDAMVKISHNNNRCILLYNRLISLIEKNITNTYYDITSFSRLMSILHPKQFGNEFSNLWKFEREVTFHALRVGIAAAIGIWIAQVFMPDHGYWIPFTAIIVAQPYATATLRRGMQRSFGTLMGILVGFLIINLPHAQFWNYLVIFSSSILAVYFFKKNYGVTSFFMTLIVVGLLTIKPPIDNSLLWIRIIATLIGSFIIILINYLLFKRQSDKSLDELLSDSISKNYSYFIYGIQSFQANKDWMQYKKNAENSNVTFFNSYNRLRTDFLKKNDNQKLTHYFSIITHLIRCTKELNNFFAHLESPQDLNKQGIPIDLFYYEINKKFAELIKLSESQMHITPEIHSFSFSPNLKIYLEKLLLELDYLKEDIINLKQIN